MVAYGDLQTRQGHCVLVKRMQCNIVLLCKHLCLHSLGFCQECGHLLGVEPVSADGHVEGFNPPHAHLAVVLVLALAIRCLKLAFCPL